MVLGLLASAGCTADAGPAWAHSAEDWAAAFEATWATGATNAARFYAPDVDFDHAGVSGLEGTGVAELAQAIRNEIPLRDLDDHVVTTPSDQVYLATTGLIHPVILTADDLIPMAYVEQVGPSGITDELFARSPDGPSEIAAAREMLAGYVTAWGSGQPTAVGALYSPEATVVDSLAGVTAAGPAAIAALAAQPAEGGGLPGASLPGLPIGGADATYYAGAPAAYSNGSFAEAGNNAIVLLLDVAGDCPGRVGVHLRLGASQRIVSEERFHRIDAVRRCLPPEQLPHGWWQSATLPALPPVHRTSSLPVGRHLIAVWTSGERPEGLFRWALQRFADAGLPPPLPNSVAFLPDIPDAWQAYGFATGSNAPDLGVPLDNLGACVEPDCPARVAAKHATLHELAHLWLTPPYFGIPTWSPTDQRGRLWARGLGLAWGGPDLSWEQRAGERAAEVLAWGLMDEPFTADARLGPVSCGELAADFTALTYSTPDPRACAEPADVSEGSG